MNKDHLLSVLITNYNTIDFVKLNLYSLKKLTKNPYKILINDNGSDKKDIDFLKQINNGNDIFVNFRKQTNNAASFAHSQALDILIGLADTKFTVVLDSDCTFLLKHWDDIMIKEINDEVKIVGSALAKGRSGLKPDDFPFQFAVLFETQIYKNLAISCMPKDISKGEDTCWEWKPKFVNSGYKGKIFITKNTRDFTNGPFSSLLGVEEYYIKEDKLIASHFGRGSNQGAGKYYHKPIFKFPVIGRLIREYLAKQDKARWISVCRDIIDNQG